MPNKNKKPKPLEGTRFPRPKGFTMALQYFHNSQNKEVIKKLKLLTIQEWTMNNYRLNGEIYTLNQLAQYIGESIGVTMLGVNKALVRMAGLFDGGKDKAEWARAQISGALFRSLETEALVAQQADILMASQGAEYKPFISGEVNRSLANLIAAQKPRLEILKLIQEKSPDPIMPLSKAEDNKTIQYISPDQAISLIRDSKPSMLEDLALVEAYLGQDPLPNVDARTQDLTSIGIKTMATEARQLEAPKSKKDRPKRDKQEARSGHRSLPEDVEDEDEYKI